MKSRARGNRLAVEIAAQKKIPGFRVDQGIAGGGIHLGLQNLAGVGNGVTARAVHLGGAAQGVGILNAFAVPV